MSVAAAASIVRPGVMAYRRTVTQRETRRIGFDWSRMLRGGDALDLSSWTGSDQLTIASPSVVGSVTTVLVSGGSPDCTYLLTNTITTEDGETRQAVIELTVVAGNEATGEFFTGPYYLEWEDGVALEWDDGEEIELA
jgi:hypothetical protein